MFDFVRKHNKVVMIVLSLVVLAFIVTAGYGLGNLKSSGVTVATVGNLTISQEEWDFEAKKQADSIRASRPNVDPKQLDTAEFRYSVLERMVNEKVIALAADDLHLQVSDERFKRLFSDSPDFAPLRNSDGSFNKEAYTQIATSQGMSTGQLDALIRKQIALRQVQGAISESTTTPAVQVQTAFNALFEHREVQVARVLAADYRAQVNPSDAEVEAYYKNNPTQFQAPEVVDAEYVVLDLESVKKTITVDEAELKAYYEQNQNRYAEPEQRRASHILIQVGKDATAAQRQQARERAQTLLEQARKAPDSFAELATKNSQDQGSAPQGGDLGFFAHSIKDKPNSGTMVKPFEDATYAMKKGEISDIVESDFGFHIIKLTDIKAAHTKTFEEARVDIEPQLKTQKAQKKFPQVSEIFENSVFEQPNSLKPTADKLQLEVKTANGIQRKPMPGSKDLLANPKVVDAIFKPESLEKKQNTKTIEVTPTQLLAARVTRYSPAQTKPYAEVRDVARELLIQSRALELAKKDGQDKLQAWKANPEAARLDPAFEVSRDKAESLPATVLDPILQADASTLPAWVGIDLGKQGYAIVRINKVQPRPAPTEDVAKQERDQYRQSMSQVEANAYLDYLKAKYKVVITTPKPAPTTPPEAL